MATRVGLKAWLNAMGLEPQVRMARMSQDKKVEAILGVYAMISKQDGLPTVRIALSDMTGNHGRTVAISYEPRRIKARLMKAVDLVNAIAMARALAMAGIVEFYDDLSEETPKASKAEAPSDMAAILAALANNPEALAKLMTLMSQSQGANKPQEEEGGRIEL